MVLVPVRCCSWERWVCLARNLLTIGRWSRNCERARMRPAWTTTQSSIRWASAGRWQFWKREAMRYQLARWNLAAGLAGSESLIADCQARLDEAQTELDEYIAKHTPAQ
jgi:hypothetical protein